MDTLHALIPVSPVSTLKVDEVRTGVICEMHVRYKSEIVHSGFALTRSMTPKQTGKHLEPKDFMEMRTRG